MRKLILAAAAAWALAPNAGQSQTLVLNTGYDHANIGLYAPGTQDQYWIKIASYEPPTTGTTTVPVAGAWVLTPPSIWAAPLSTTTTVPAIPSRWIGPRNSIASTAGTSPRNPSFAIYRKCFCLAQGFQNVEFHIQVRADDLVQIWVNDITRTLIPAGLGNFGTGVALTNSNLTVAGLAPGRNCIYVLVEDIQGNVGFDLAGTVTAASGLGLMPAAGVDGSFTQCQCPTTPGPSPNGTPSADATPPRGTAAPAVAAD